jgi:hypothetical protein
MIDEVKDCSYYSMKEVVFLLGFATGFDCVPLVEPNKSYTVGYSEYSALFLLKREIIRIAYV